MKDLSAFAQDVVQRAGGLLRERWRSPRAIRLKSPIDLVTDCDRAVEEFLVAEIKRRFPDHAIIAEETGERDIGRSDYCWIIDPIDGTTNWVHGCPHFAISVAVTRGSRPSVGVVYDPMREEVFSAVAGAGATLNGSAMAPSETGSLADSLLATGFAADCRERADFYLGFVRAFMRRSRGLRRFGAAALDLAYVACGRFDGFWEWGLSPWDTAAGALIVREAGGRTSDYSGAPHDIFGPQTVASNGRIHAEMLAVLARELEVRGHPETPKLTESDDL